MYGQKRLTHIILLSLFRLVVQIFLLLHVLQLTKAQSHTMVMDEVIFRVCLILLIKFMSKFINMEIRHLIMDSLKKDILCSVKAIDLIGRLA